MYIVRSSLLFRFSSFLNSNSTRSYYEILQVQPNASSKQIRKNFLKKARQLHPDHNPSEQAHQQFKLLKQAYEVLRDPQRRYMYDTGISNENNDPSQAYSNQAYHGESNTKSKKYYQNKWYGYTKNKYYDQRDDFYQRKQEYLKGISKWAEGGAYYRLSAGLLVIIGYFGYDYMKTKQNRKQVENKHIRHMLQGQKQDKKTKALNRYIQSRSKIHQVLQ